MRLTAPLPYEHTKARHALLQNGWVPFSRPDSWAQQPPCAPTPLQDPTAAAIAARYNVSSATLQVRKSRGRRRWAPQSLWTPQLPPTPRADGVAGAGRRRTQPAFAERSAHGGEPRGTEPRCVLAAAARAAGPLPRATRPPHTQRGAFRTRTRLRSGRCRRSPSVRRPPARTPSGRAASITGSDRGRRQCGRHRQCGGGRFAQ